MNKEIYLEHSKYIFPKLTYDEWLLEMDIDKLKYLDILRINSQKYNKEELYPEDFSKDDKLKFDMFGVNGPNTDEADEVEDFFEFSELKSNILTEFDVTLYCLAI